MKHSRLFSLEMRNFELLSQCNENMSFDIDLTNNETVLLIKWLEQFENVLVESYKGLEPRHLIDYLVRFAHLTGNSLAVLRVLNQPREIAVPRLLLFSAARRVLNRGMKLIGLEPINQM